MIKKVQPKTLVMAIAASTIGVVTSLSYAQDYQYISHKPTGLKITSCSTTDGTGVTAEVDESRCGQWTQVPNGNYFHLQNAESGKYIRPATADNGSAIEIQPNTWKGNWTQWSYEDRGDGFGHLINRSTGKQMFTSGVAGETVEQQPASWRGDYTRWQFINAGVGPTPTPIVTATPTSTPTPTPTPPGGCIAALNQYEAEAGSIYGGAQIYDDGAASGGQGVAYISSVGAGFSITNIVATDFLEVFYASEFSGKISLRINGTDAGDINFSATGSWVGNYISARYDGYIPANSTIDIFYDQGDSPLNVDFVTYQSGCVFSTPTPTPTLEPTPEPPSGYWSYNSHNSTEDGGQPHNNNSVAPLPRTSGPDYLSTPINGAIPPSHGFAFDIADDSLTWRWGSQIVKGDGDSGLEMFCSEDDGHTFSSTAVTNGTATIPCSEPYTYFFRYTHPNQLNNNPASAYIYTGGFTTESRVDVASYEAFTDSSANWMNFRHPISQDGITSAILDAQHNADRLRNLDRYTMWVDDRPGNVRLNYDLNGSVIRVESMRNSQGFQNGQQYYSVNQNPGFDNIYSYGQVVQFEMTALAGATGAQTYNDFVYYTVGHGFGAYGDPRLNSAGRAGSTMWFSDNGAYIELEKDSIFTRPITTAYREQDMDDFMVGHHWIHGIDPRKRGSTEFDDPDARIGDRSCGGCHFRDGRGSEIIQTAKGPRLPPAMYGVKLLESIEGREAGMSWDGSVATVADEITSALTNFHNVEIDAVPDELLHLLTAYTELLTVPNRDPGSYDDPSVAQGEALFADVGCASCHTPVQKTRTDVDPQWANLTIRPYTDMKTWDLGTGAFRTAPLWGLGHNIELLNRHGRALLFMHDGSATSVDAAVQGHNGDAGNVKAAYNALSDEEKQTIVNFVRTL